MRPSEEIFNQIFYHTYLQIKRQSFFYKKGGAGKGHVLLGNTLRMFCYNSYYEKTIALKQKTEIPHYGIN